MVASAGWIAGLSRSGCFRRSWADPAVLAGGSITPGAWVVADRSGRRHDVVIEPGGKPRLENLVGRRLAALVPLQGPRLAIGVDGQVRAEMARPTARNVATLSRPIRLDDGTEIQAYAESSDGGLTFTGDLYVDGRSPWSGNQEVAHFRARRLGLVLQLQARTRARSRVWALLWAVVFYGSLLWWVAGHSALLPSIMLISLAMGALTMAVLMVSVWLSRRSGTGSPAARERAILLVAVAAVAVGLVLCVVVLARR